MMGRRFISFLRRNPSSSSSSSGKSRGVRRVVSGALICVTGGVGLSALDDLLIYSACTRHHVVTLIAERQGYMQQSAGVLMVECYVPYVQGLMQNYYRAGGLTGSSLSILTGQSKAMEKASKNRDVVQAIGEPIARGPWYNASLAVTHRRHSVSCTFPVSGPHGTGIFQLRAVRNGDSWLPFFRPRDWEILIMEALLHVPENEDKNKTFRIRISDDVSPPAFQP